MNQTPIPDDKLILLADEPDRIAWDVEVDILIIGCGGCGLIAGLAAAQQGARVLIVEKESTAGGNTSLSQGMFPAAGSMFQKQAGIDDSPEQMAQDILAKNKNESDPEMTLHIARHSGRLIDWLYESEGIELKLVENFLYPGHSCHRIHAPKTTKGDWLVNKLLEAAERYDNLDIAYAAPVLRLVARSGDMAVLGAETDISGVGKNLAKAQKTILALNGFGANREMVARYIPEMADAYYFGHEGNTGEGILWGEALGGKLVNMGAYQAHGSVAHPHGTLLSWAVISLGGYQVNSGGRRFVNENHGYSEHALDVLAQQNGTAVEIFDQRIFNELQGFEDFRKCRDMGAVKKFDSIEELAASFRIDPTTLVAEHEQFQKAASGATEDRLGRKGLNQPLTPPYYGVRVTGALFHTQGGLLVDKQARVIRNDGRPVDNLYAGGGVAVGLSGSGVAGYLSANGLLAALTLGMIAGQDAGKAV